MQSNKFLILASGSQGRLGLLKGVSILPDLIVSPDTDESPQPKELPRAYCDRVADEKFEAAVKKISTIKEVPSEYVVIVGDTVASCGRRMLHKSSDPEVIREHLKLISGRRHKLYTGVRCGLVENGKVKAVRRKLVTSILKFKRMTEKEIEQLIKSKEPEGKAGGYTLSGLAGKHLMFISGSYSNVIGLPLYETTQMLNSLGYNTTE